MGYGDELLAAGQAQRLYDKAPDLGPVAIVDPIGRIRQHEVWMHNPAILTPQQGRTFSAAARTRALPKRYVVNAPGARPYLRYPFTQQTGFRYNGRFRARDNVGEIYLTDRETERAQAVLRGGPFVLIEPTVKPIQTQNKDWGVDRYQRVVRLCRGVRFVRVVHTAGARRLIGTETLTDLTFREVVALLAVAEAYLGPEGGLHHAARIVGCPAVVIFGGCIPFEVMGYPEQTSLYDTAAGSPCCRFLPCDHCRRAMARILPETVASLLQSKLREDIAS